MRQYRGIILCNNQEISQIFCKRKSEQQNKTISSINQCPQRQHRINRFASPQKLLDQFLTKVSIFPFYIQSRGMGNTNLKEESLQIQAEFSNSNIQSVPKLNNVDTKGKCRNSKCTFVYIQPKFYKEDEEIESFQNISLNSNSSKQNIVREQQQYLGLEQLQKNRCTLQMIFIEKQKQKGKITVQWQHFIKIKQKSFLQDYTQIKQIGKGAFGSVSKVCKKHGKIMRAAKKIMISSITKKKENKDKLLAQILIMKKTDHPNINKLYEVYEFKNKYVLIMDLCEGGDLFHLIKKQKVFNEKRVSEIMKQILTGVLYLHKNKIVHRDLKPENMLYDTESKLVKISDFGTAVELTNPNKKLSQIIGSPLYIAPEVLAGRYNAQCDTWSCGIILYVMLCGSPPFSGRTPQQIFEKIKTARLNFTESIWKKRSKQSMKIISQMLIKDPNERITIDEVLKSSWFENCSQQNNQKEITGQFLNNLTSFYFKNKLKAVVYTYIASQLFSNKDKQRLMKCFKDIDKDNDGVIEKKQLLQVFKTYKGQQYSEEQLEKIIDIVDTNESGHIDFTQFLVAASNEEELLCRERLENAFSYFDTDHSGYITIDQIQQFLDNSEDTDHEIKDIFDQADRNGDGKISLKQFIALLLQKNKTQKIIDD